MGPIFFKQKQMHSNMAFRVLRSFRQILRYMFGCASFIISIQSRSSPPFFSMQV